MIEANENIDLVTVRRQQELQQAQESYRNAVAEGRLAVRPNAAEPAQLAVAVVEVQPAETAPQPKDAEAAWRHTRLAVTAGLVVLLFAVWIWQKRAGR